MVLRSIELLETAGPAPAVFFIYSSLKMSVRAQICLIALTAALSDQESDQERGASKQLAAPLPYTQLQSATTRKPKGKTLYANNDREASNRRISSTSAASKYYRFCNKM
jgi:hypothetical protein